MASLTRQRRAAALGRGPWERDALCDALSRRGHARHRAVRQMLRFECFQNERRTAPSLLAALAFSERALPQASKQTVSVGPRRISARSRNQSRDPFACNEKSLKVSNLIQAISLAAEDVHRYVGREADPSSPGVSRPVIRLLGSLLAPGPPPPSNWS